MPARYFYVLLLFAVLLPRFSFAQDNSFSINFNDSTGAANNEGLIDAYVKLVNTSGNDIEGIFETYNSSEDIYLVQQKPKNLILKARDSLFIPVKAIVSHTATAGTQSTIEAVFTVAKTGESKSIILPVTIKVRKLVKMFLPESNLIYENKGDSLLIPVQIFNEGNTEQQVTVVTRFPAFILSEGMETTMIRVKAFSDTTFVVKKQVNRNILNQDDFSISVTALYDNGDIVGIGSIRANSIRQDRRYRSQLEQGSNIFQQANQVSASYQFSNANIASYFLYANAQAEINDAILYGSIDANMWVDTREALIRNTWMGYKEKTYGVQAGNISRFEDLSLLGRGVESFYQPDNKNKFEAGALDKAYNLIDDPATSLGKSAWATFTRNDGWAYNGYNVSIIYDYDSFAATQNFLASSRFSVLKTDNFRLKAGGALSNIASEITGANEIGGAAEVHASGKASKMFYSSANYISSGYFSGIRKGVISLNERIQWTLGNYNVWSVANYLSVAPKNFGRDYFLTSKFSTSRFDVGISRQFSSLTVSLLPYYYTDTRTEKLLNDTGPRKYTLNAGRLSLGLNYFNRPTNQNVNLTVEGGSFTTNFNHGSELHFKTSLNYNWKIFNVLFFYQHNYFYLGEIVSGLQQNNDETYYIMTLTPTIQGKFFNSRLSLNGGIMFSKSSVIDEISQFNCHAEYKITNDLTVTGNAYYSDLRDLAYSVNTYQIGISKQFNPIRVDKTKHDLDVYVYYDKTGKGPDDTENVPAAGQIIIIGGKAFKTNSKGQIKYRALPEGTYDIRPINTDDWYTYDRSLLINTDMKVAIGLIKTGSVRGKITYVSTDKSYDITKRLAGLSVVAVDEAGNVFNTKTNDTGGFALYLPKGIYTLSLEKSGVSEYVEVRDNNIYITVEPNEVKEAEFTLVIKEKRVETKKFTSRGFPTMSTDKKKKKK